MTLGSLVRDAACAEDRKLLTHLHQNKGYYQDAIRVLSGYDVQPFCPPLRVSYIWSPVRSTACTNQNLDETEVECETGALSKMIKPLSLCSISLIHPSFLTLFYPQAPKLQSLDGNQ